MPKHAYIFSFNRGKYLLNCIKSMQELMPEYKLHVYDDGSNDPETVSILAALKKNVTIYFSRSDLVEHKTGGLYGNMNAAMLHAKESGAQFPFFIQDDMQIVRRWTRDDDYRILNLFSKLDNCMQVDTCFRKRQFERQDTEYTDVVLRSGYVRSLSAKHHGMKGITPVGFFHSDRFALKFNSFLSNEVLNEQKAIRSGLRVVYDAYPHMMWLPFPEAYRGKHKTSYSRIVEKLGRVGCYPYVPMTDTEINALMHRNLSEVPVAENWLRCPLAPASARWSFTGGLDNVRARGGIWKLVAIALSRTKLIGLKF